MTTNTSGRLDLVRVNALVRDVIAGYSLPFEILSIDPDVAGWRMLLRDMSHRVIDVSLAYATSAAQLRAQLKERLDTTCA